MKIISFELTMPNVGSWNGKWSGQDKKYYVIEKYADRFFNKNEHFKALAEKGWDSWYYSWGDGWGASIRAEIIDSQEAKKRRKVSSGFCSYEWMIAEIKNYGKIKNQ